MEPFGLVVRFTLRPGAAAAFDALATETLAGIVADEPDTLVYAVSRPTDEADVRLFFEVYRDRSAFDHHEAQEHTRRFLAEREQHLDHFEVTFLSVVAAKGIAGLGP
jgi:quinol monooxygenase YgiN